MKGTARSSGGEGVLPNSKKTNPAAVSAAGARNLRVPRDVHPEADDDWLREVLALSAYERR